MTDALISTEVEFQAIPQTKLERDIAALPRVRKLAARGRLKYTTRNAWLYRFMRFTDWRIYCDVCQRNYEYCVEDEKTWRDNDLVVDHSHKTGHIRGLVCHRCNSALGFLRDDLEAAHGAYTYLRDRGYGSHRYEENSLSKENVMYGRYQAIYYLNRK